MNITITGNLGSGKSSVCKELKKSGYTVISAGDIFREIAAEKGMTVIELNEAAKKDRSIDDMLDLRSTQLGKTMDHTVFDSRLAWHFVENSFKVFLLVDTREAARRVFAGDSRSAEVYQDLEEARAGLEERAKLEQERFCSLYGIDYYDAGNYDLIIESTCASPQQIAQEIERNFALYQKQPFSTKVELNLQCLHPYAECPPEKQGQGQSETLCAEGDFCITQKDGAYCLCGDAARAAAAIASGKVFAVAGRLETRQDGTVKPDGGADGGMIKSGYAIDFTKIFQL
ncbi:MAG: dephospho-CoA kinase [Eubacterium sp.]|nr:dephospho-CoA kinase [Eubacterium sp.]